MRFVLFLWLGFMPLSAQLVPWPENPWYWSDQGKPILLLGGSDDDNLFQWPSDKLIPQLDRIAGAGGNVVRNTMSDRPVSGFELYPFSQREDGLYDPEKWNEDYWKRFDHLWIDIDAGSWHSEDILEGGVQTLTSPSTVNMVAILQKTSH